MVEANGTLCVAIDVISGLMLAVSVDMETVDRVEGAGVVCVD
jgi:hypothetical protein